MLQRWRIEPMCRDKFKMTDISYYTEDQQINVFVKYSNNNILHSNEQASNTLLFGCEFLNRYNIQNIAPEGKHSKVLQYELSGEQPN